MKINQPRAYISSAVFLLLVSGFSAGYYAKKIFQDQPLDGGHPIRQANGKFGLINPLLAYEISEKKNFKEFAYFGQKIGDFVSREEGSGFIADAGIYFRDLDTGRWTGFNEESKFSPASLLKVPLMISYLKAAEDEPDILSQRISYDGSFDDNKKENIPPLKQISKAESYSVNELLRYMIAYSDNNATRLLFDHLDQSAIREIFSDLGVYFPKPGELGDYMSPKSYSLFFRVLYNATYLDRTMSEKALELLVEPDFPQGLAAGVPDNVPVAQKFGEHSFEGNLSFGNKELHDCGIIYNPKHNYILCVMTKGKDFQELTDFIRDISKMVYEEVDSDYRL